MRAARSEVATCSGGRRLSAPGGLRERHAGDRSRTRFHPGRLLRTDSPDPLGARCNVFTHSEPMGSSLSIASRFRVRERRSSARLKAGRLPLCPGLLALGFEEVAGLFVGQDSNPSPDFRRETATGRAQQAARGQHPCRVGPGSGSPRSIGGPSVPTLTSPHSSPFGAAPTHPPWPANRPRLRWTAPLLSKKRRERARYLASSPANDGCLVHPVSRFESRRGRGLPFGWLAPRPARRKRRAEIVERSGWTSDGRRRIQPSLRRAPRAGHFCPERLPRWREHQGARAVLVGVETRAGETRRSFFGCRPITLRMSRDMTREERPSAFASEHLRRTETISRQENRSSARDGGFCSPRVQAKTTTPLRLR